MPGQYKYQTFVDDLKNKQCHASFKGPKRFRGPGISGLIDKVLSCHLAQSLALAFMNVFHPFAKCIL